MAISRKLDEVAWLKNRIGYYLYLYKKNKWNEKRHRYLDQADHFAYQLYKLYQSSDVTVQREWRQGGFYMKITFINFEKRKEWIKLNIPEFIEKYANGV